MKDTKAKERMKNAKVDKLVVMAKFNKDVRQIFLKKNESLMVLSLIRQWYPTLLVGEILEGVEL